MLFEEAFEPLRLITAVIHTTQLAEHFKRRSEIFKLLAATLETIELNAPGFSHRNNGNSDRFWTCIYRG